MAFAVRWTRRWATARTRRPACRFTASTANAASRRPEQLKGLDALVFDIQDVGCRFYTYISTMGLCMEAAAEAGIEFIVLDRANPINGVTIEGPVLTEKTSFVGFHPIPLRYGMTMGELARMFNGNAKPTPSSP